MVQEVDGGFIMPGVPDLRYLASADGEAVLKGVMGVEAGAHAKIRQWTPINRILKIHLVHGIDPYATDRCRLPWYGIHPVLNGSLSTNSASIRSCTMTSIVWEPIVWLEGT
jgi:hypothetical protein